MSIQSNLAAIEQYLAIAKQEDVKLAKGTKSSAAKVRSALLEIGKECSQSRKLALDAGKQIPVKKKIPKEEKVEVKEADSENLPDESPVLETKSKRGRKVKPSAA